MSFAQWSWDELSPENQTEERFNFMRFTLYLDGSLPSSANNARLKEKHHIREKLHWQLLQLFRDPVSLPKPASGDWAGWSSWQWPELIIDKQYDTGLGWKEGFGWKESEAVVQVGNRHFLAPAGHFSNLKMEIPA